MSDDRDHKIIHFPVKAKRACHAVIGSAEIHQLRPRPSFLSLDLFTRGYIESALWTEHESLTEDGGREAAYYENLSSAAIARMEQDCLVFRTENEGDLSQYYDHSLGEDQAGHDFWLTRNGHGAGFWDRAIGEDLGERLSQAASKMGTSDLYWSDDGFVEVG